MAWTTGISGVWTGDLKDLPECLLWVGIGPLHIVYTQVIKVWRENHKRAGERIRVQFILKIKNFCTSRFYTHTHTHHSHYTHLTLFLFLIPKANQLAHLFDSELDYLSSITEAQATVFFSPVFTLATSKTFSALQPGVLDFLSKTPISKRNMASLSP